MVSRGTMNLHVVSPLRNFWVRVFIGEGQLGGVAARPVPQTTTSQPDGDYLLAYGLPTALIGRDLIVTADIQKVGLSDKASVTVEMWETIPAHYIMPGSGLSATDKYDLASFCTSGEFGADGKAHLTLSVIIR